MYHILDLHFLQLPHAVASFLLESDEGPILIETGPYSTFSSLKKGLEEHGYVPEDIKHVLLTHIHFDHAGAAWAFAKEGATIYVHPFGMAHMHDPEKLVASATRIYGNEMNRLWGTMKGIPKEQLKAVNHGECIRIGNRSFWAWHTPGHAKHHIAWQLEEVLFSGDIAGIKIEDGPVVPPCPPPEIDIEDWHQSIDLILSKKPKKLVLTHFGDVEHIEEHAQELKDTLTQWKEWMKTKWEQQLSTEALITQFKRYTAEYLHSKGASESEIMKYEEVNPSWMSASGLARYWKKKI